MTKPAYLVEGDLEQKFVKAVCPGCPVRKINCNSDNASLQAIADRVGTLARLLHKKCSPIIVVFDREGRKESSSQIKSTLCKLLEAQQIDAPVIVGIPDRQIENWILADYEKFASLAGIKPAATCKVFEGTNGKCVLKKAIGNKRTYVETIDGVAWLKSARADVIRKNSASFQEFIDGLSALEHCWWLRSTEAT